MLGTIQNRLARRQVLTCEYDELSENNLFKVNDPASLASKIDYWIEHDEARKQAEISYQKYAQQFRLENCMRQMEQMIINCARQCATERYMSC